MLWGVITQRLVCFKAAGLQYLGVRGRTIGAPGPGLLALVFCRCFGAFFAAVTHSSKEASSLAPVSPGDKVQTPHSLCLFLSANSWIIQSQCRALRRCAAIRRRPDLYWGAERVGALWRSANACKTLHPFFFLFWTSTKGKKVCSTIDAPRHHA